ncbi:MAG: hypothetical protein FJ189_10595 [Gammaproteobacteria bacterium]|nr:hypothetical protein [Gammaproteobacteria bacterium]
MLRLLAGLAFFPRLLFALVLVFATYNPEPPYSYFYWALSDLGTFNSVKAFVGVLLLTGWTIYISATVHSLGWLGLLLAAALLGTGAWAVIDQGWLNVDNTKVLTYLILVLIAALLAIGLGWSVTRRKITGTVDVDDGPNR